MFIQSNKEVSLEYMGYNFKYILKKRKYDNNSLIIVFSGFGAKSDFTYDFLSSLKTTRASVLWIKDDFHNNSHATYYLDKFNNTGLEESIINFIYEALKYLQVEKDKCILLGCSKGGASALYYGLKYNFKNILVSAPTTLVGSSIAGITTNGKPRSCANFIMDGEINESKIKNLDNRFLNVLENDINLNKNIFLISSKADPRHSFQIEPFLNKFSKYLNFNYIESQSCLVRSHQDVTFFNAPLILSILNCLTFNLEFKFLNNITMGDSKDKKAKITKEPVLNVQSLDFDENNNLHPKGVFFLRGLECKEYEDLEYRLIFRSEKNEFIYRLARDNKSSITKDYYEDAFVNYDKAFFCTKRYQGLSINDMTPGLYQIYIKIIMKNGEQQEVPLNYKFENSIISFNKKFELLNLKEYTYISVKN